MSSTILGFDRCGLHRELRREKKTATLMGTLVKKEHIVFPYIRETFYSARIQHNDIKPSGATSLEEFGKLSVNAIEGINVIEKDVRAMVCPMTSETTPRNKTTIDMHIVFQLS